jgi:hypothetical protein
LNRAILDYRFDMDSKKKTKGDGEGDDDDADDNEVDVKVSTMMCFISLYCFKLKNLVVIYNV